MITLKHEGIYWTIYLDDMALCCGELEDMEAESEHIAKRVGSGESYQEIMKDYLITR